ncbi:hypothetical protein EMEDMD4_150015 [Sinorhizobium medicae]|uniref:Uncharacterized protein n=1 Tax=Sinorhizobium medicae TaxID=110321 RepID=A0A508WS74_9HYPH|nr:hypothetical protein EMEDMD4_150015 [Sinorhizobium medicae]
MEAGLEANRRAKRNFVPHVEKAWQAEEQCLKIVHDFKVPERYAFAIHGSFIFVSDRECPNP